MIAAVDGRAAGAGLSLALACDVRIAADSAVLAPGLTTLGLAPDAGTSWLATRLLGAGRAFEWLTTGRELTASQARDWGLVSELVPGHELPERAAEVARLFAAMPTLAVGRDEAAARPRADGHVRAAARERGARAGAARQDRRLRRGRRRVTSRDGRPHLRARRSPIHPVRIVVHRRPAPLAPDRGAARRARAAAPGRARRVVDRRLPGLDRDVGADADPRRGARGPARLVCPARALRRPRVRLLVPRRRPVPAVPRMVGTYPVDVDIAPPVRQSRWSVALPPRARDARARASSSCCSSCSTRSRSWAGSRRSRRPDAERNARPHGVLLALPGTNLRVPGFCSPAATRDSPEAAATSTRRVDDVRSGRPLAASRITPSASIVTDDLQRSRLTTFFRPILAIPHLILVSLWGLAVSFALIIAWFAALFTGRVPCRCTRSWPTGCATPRASRAT